MPSHQVRLHLPPSSRRPRIVEIRFADIGVGAIVVGAIVVGAIVEGAIVEGTIVAVEPPVQRTPSHQPLPHGQPFPYLTSRRGLQLSALQGGAALPPGHPARQLLMVRAL